MAGCEAEKWTLGMKKFLKILQETISRSGKDLNIFD